MHTLSAIIPTYNEAVNIVELLARLRAMPEIAEIIVCDGGSRDDTVALAREAGAIVVFAHGRGAQLNAGAAAATGKVLWFIHADAVPHPRAAAAIAQAVRRPHIFGGNFRLRFDSGLKAARAFEAIARAQRRFGLYYGDSGIWLCREVFAAMGGFQAWPLFEDYDLARRLEKYSKRHGGRTRCLTPPLVAAARRFQNNPWSTLAKWLALQVLFWLGVAPHRLARLYR